MPVLLLVDHDGVRGEAQQADDLGVPGGAEEDDDVPLVDQLLEEALFLDHPGAGAVDDVQAAALRPLEDLGADAVRTDDDRGSLVHVVEGLHAVHAEADEVADHALVVHDLAQRMRGPAGDCGLLGLVDGLADAVAEAGAVRDSDFLHHAHSRPMFAHVRRSRRPAVPSDQGSGGFSG